MSNTKPNSNLEVLLLLFKDTYREPFRITQKQFMANHHERAAKIQELVENNTIFVRDGQTLRVPLLSLATLSDFDAEANSVLYLCGHLFNVLRQAFIDSADSSYTVSQIATMAEMPENQVARAFSYLLDSPICDGLTLDPNGLHRDISLSSSIVTVKTFDELIEQMRAARKNALAVEKPKKPSRSVIFWDAFISHASEDKEDFVRPLAEVLTARGLKIWFDEMTLTIGDSLRQSIDQGLAKSRFGIVVVSRHFLEKPWPKMELDGLVAREGDGKKVILPIFHNLTAKEVRKYSPILAGRLAASSADGIEAVAANLLEAINAGPQSKTRRATKGLSYGAIALADIDFPINAKALVGKLIEDFRVYTWSVQNAAFERFLKLDWSKITADEAFVLGRNVWQVAQGGERRTIKFVENFRREVANIPSKRACDLLAGVLFEAYFDSKGQFRGEVLKDRHLKPLLATVGAKQFAPAIDFMRQQLKPHTAQIESTFRLPALRVTKPRARRK